MVVSSRRSDGARLRWWRKFRKQSLPRVDAKLVLKFGFSSSTTPLPGVPMSIAFRDSDLSEYRKLIQAIPDDDLIKRGQEDEMVVRRREDREHDAVRVL